MLRLTTLVGCLLLAVPQDPANSVRALIEKLGSDEIALRDEAAMDLRRIGRGALPALNASFASASGEQKVRLQRIIEHITAFGTPPLVTLETKDRPLREIVGELERQSGVPVRVAGAVAEIKAGVSAKGALLWKVVEDLCRARGDLMYRFKNDSVEIHPGKFRALPSAEHQGLRVFIDQFAWDRNLAPWDSSQFKMQGGVLTPAGARVIWMQIVVDELRDDKGAELTTLVEMAPMPDGDLYGLNSRRILFPQTYRPPQGAPSPEATKFTRFRGKAVVLLAGGERLLGCVNDPLSASNSPAPEGLPTFGVDRWKRQDGYLHLDYTVGWESESVKSLTRRMAPLLVIRLRDGHWIPPTSERVFRTGNEGAKRGSGSVWAEIPEDANIGSLEVVVPDPVLTVEIPFDFRDIPLK